MLSMGGQTIDMCGRTAELMITMLGAIAAFKCALLLECQRKGVAKAKLGGSPVWGREGATPLGTLYAASAAMTRLLPARRIVTRRGPDSRAVARRRGGSAEDQLGERGP